MCRPLSQTICELCDKIVRDLTETNSGLQRYPSRRSIRKREYDYRQAGVYFVTLCTHQHVNLFGHILQGEVRLSYLGSIAFEEWQYLALARKNVQLDRFVVMPNHFHGLVIIEESWQSNQLTGHSSPVPKRTSSIKAGSLGAIIGQYKAAVTRRARSEGLVGDGRIWQRNYHDRIVRNEESLNEIRRYIVENPARWAEDSLYVE